MKRFRKMKDNPIDLSEQNTKYQIFGHGGKVECNKDEVLKRRRNSTRQKSDLWWSDEQ